MHKATKAFLVATILLVGCVRTVPAQSLADIARKEEERRKQTTKGAKTYTNKDLGNVPQSSVPPPPISVPSSGTATTTEPGATPAVKGEVRDQAYWSGRMKVLLTQVDRDQTYLDAMQSRVNALTTDFVNRDDPAQRAVIETDRQKAMAELNRLKTAVADAQKGIADLEEEARRANVPPGWLR